MKKAAVLLAAVALVATAASPALAARRVKVITPDKLTVDSPAAKPAEIQNAYWAKGTAAGGSFSAPLKLPVGSVIKKIVVFGQDAGTPSGSVDILVYKEDTFCFLGSCSAVTLDAAGFDGLGIGWHSLEATADPALARIDRGEKALLMISVDGDLFVGTIKVYYTTP